MVETSEPVKRGRGRPRKDGSSPETVKSDVPRVDKSKAQSFLTANDLNPILEGVFGLVSMRFGDVWKLSPAEAESISKPLVKILEKMNLADRVSQMSDGTALVFALVTIIAPRIMLSASTKEQKKEKVLKENGGVTSEQSRETSSNSKNNIREIGRKPSDGEYVKALSTQLNFGY